MNALNKGEQKKVRTIKPLNEGDVLEVKKGFVAGKIGSVIPDDASDKTPDRIKLDFGHGWCGWHDRANLRIIKRKKQYV
jgi:hypothetical protein